MLIKKIATAMLVVGSMGSAFANVCSNTDGRIICGSGEVDQISGNGVVKISGTYVKGLTSVNGVFTGHNSDILDLDVNGTATLTQCLVRRATIIKGTLVANETKFDDSINLYTVRSNFDKSLINGDINIKKSSEEQKLYLQNATEVNGDVIFEAGQGEIILSADSKIKGNILGATVINK